MQHATSDLAALYAAILANPAEDVPRLMYADELDSVGGKANCAHARVIRSMIQLEAKYGTPDKWTPWNAEGNWIKKTLSRNWKEHWRVPPLISPFNPGSARVSTPYKVNPFFTSSADLRFVHANIDTPQHWLCVYYFQRGFFSHAIVPWHHWEMFGDTIVKHVPIASVELLTAPAYTHEMFQSVGGISTWAAQSGVDFYHKIFDKTEVECHTANYHKWATMELLRARWPTVADWQLPSP